MLQEVGFVVFVNLNIVICDLAFTISFYFGIVVVAPRASFSFATAQKSNQKRPPLLDCPCGVPEAGGIAYEPALMRRPGAQH